MERVLCFWDQVFPLLFPSHTSKPASARMKPRLLLGRLEIQLLASPSRPCCSNTTGLGPTKKWISTAWNILHLSRYPLMCERFQVRQTCVQILIQLLASLIILASYLTFLCLDCLVKKIVFLLWLNKIVHKKQKAQLMDTKGESGGGSGGGGRGGMNWEIGIDVYTLTCIR